MIKRLQYIDDISDKFWQIEVKGVNHTVTYGRNGTAGVSQTKSFDSDELCLKSATKLIAEKEKKGYSESGEVTVSHSSTITTSKSKTNLKDLTDEIDTIIKNKKSNEVLTFLKSNLKGNKEALKKHIKKVKRYWTDYVDLSQEPGFKLIKNSYNWGRRADQVQEKIIFYFCFATYNSEEYRSIDNLMYYLNTIKEDEILNQLFIEYKPVNLSETLVILIRTNSWRSIQYDLLLELESRNYLLFQPELFAISLCSFTNTSHGLKKENIDCFEFIKKSKLCLERDIPELFNYETNIANMRDWGNTNDKVNRHWQNYFSDLIQENLFSKDTLIENCLLIQTKDWNNGIKTFYKTIFLELNITSDELIKYQDRVFALLHNSYFPIVNFGIDLVKDIYDHSKFDLKSFLEFIEPVMMRTDCKGGVKKLIPLFEKLAKSNPKSNSKICLALADVMLISDLSTQERAAKTIVKLSTNKDKDLVEKLTSYQSQLLGNVKTDLKEFLGDIIENETTDISSLSFNNNDVIIEKKLVNPISIPKDKTELLFHYGKWIASNDIIDSEIIVNSFITQQHFYDREFQEQFEPYKANFKNNYLGSTNKYFLANFIINKIENLSQGFKANFNHVEAKTIKSAYNIYVLAHNKILLNSSLPLLSMPTYYPFWIDPKTLIERLIDYEKYNEKVDHLDLAIAISRMPREKVESAIPLLSQLNNKYKKLMEFCLGISNEIDFNSHSVLDKFIGVLRQTNDKLDMTILWSVAATTYYPDREFPVFNSSTISHIPMVVKLFDSKIKFVERNSSYTDHVTKKEIIYNVWQQMHIEFPLIKYIPAPLIYSHDLIYIKEKEYYYFNPLAEGDVNYWLSINPQNTNALALWLLEHSCRIADGAKPDVRRFIEEMMQPCFHQSYYSVKLLAACFFMEKKETRMVASEVVYQLIEKNKLDIQHFSEGISFFAKNKYGVFQRFSESIISIKDTSPKHNLALFHIIESVISNFGHASKLPPNFKKLIDTFLDVKIKTKQPLNSEAIKFLESYKNNASMKKTIQQLLN